MPTAIWTGSLSLGLVVVPVRLFPAVKKKRVRFHELDRSGRRIRHVRVSEADIDWQPPPFPGGEMVLPRNEPVFPPSQDLLSNWPQPEASPGGQVAYEEIRKGFEVAPGEYVSMSREEVAALAPEKSRVIEVQQFVDVSAVDPIYFESRYFVVPDRDSVRQFALLRQALADAGRMAIAWFTLRSRRYLAGIRAYDELMLLTTMVHADEIAAREFGLPHVEQAPTDKELKMARLLIDTLSGPFEPERYPDEHRQRLLAAIEARTPVAEPAAAPSPTRVMDLMAALEASVKAAKAARAGEDKEPRQRRSKRRAG
jgi:DNA end-binding protein Ku